ncbi:hypothetical protein GPALN_004585 [Globodera pallida]|nr:hypothetical protein GPALN_004585 [Globodera pallida]
MHLLPPFVTTHHQNVAFLVLLLIIVLVRQSISYDPPQSSSDQSSSDEERRRPMQPRAITRSMSVRTRSAHSGLNDSPERKPSLSSNNSWSEDIIKLDEDRIRKTNQIKEQLCADLEQIEKNIPRSNSLKEHFRNSKNAKLSDKLLNDKSNENACEQLLPSWDPNTGRPYKDYDLRVEACNKLNALTGWVEVKEAISAMENSKQCSTIFEDDDDDGNGIDSLSKCSNSFGPDRYGNGQPEPRRSLDIASARIVSMKKSVDRLKPLLPKATPGSTSTKSTDGTLSWQNSKQRSTKSTDSETGNGTLTRRNSTSSSTSTKSTDNNGTLQRQNSKQRSTKSTDSETDNGTLTRRNSTSSSTSTKSTDNNGTLQRQSSKQRSTNSTSGSTSTKSTDNNGTLARQNSKQRSTKSTDSETGNGTLTRRNSTSGSTSTKSTDFGFSKSKKDFVEGRRSLDVRNSSYAEIGDRSKNLPCALPRSSSTRNSGTAKSVGAEKFDKETDEKCIFKESIICTVQWDVLRTGMLRMHDKNLKKDILEMCQHVNYPVQLLILQNLMNTTSSSSSESKTEERVRNVEIKEILFTYKQNILGNKSTLLNSLDRRSKGQLGEEFNKALVELRDKVVAHWTWLYMQPRAYWTCKKGP